ncbi:MAG: hypothetical protein M3014_13290 [Chloroflexota bacterium]|nr:hypothetical protein [Chloroflexota bacterium]
MPVQFVRANKRDPRSTIADITALAAEISIDLPTIVSVEETINDIRR